MCVCLTILQAEPQLLVVLLLHAVDDLASVLEAVRLLHRRHEERLDDVARRAVQDVALREVLQTRASHCVKSRAPKLVIFMQGALQEALKMASPCA